MDIETVHDEILMSVSAKQPDDQMDAYQYLYGQLSGTSANPAAIGKKIHQDAARAKAKMVRHGVMYGSAKWSMFGDRKFETESASMRVLRDGWPAKYAWAKAFQEVLGVGDSFYADADSVRKQYLEAHYEELATHDTPKGRKAAKVVAARVKQVLARDEVRPEFESAIFEFKTQTQRTIRMRSFMPAMQNIPKITGTRADCVIIDDLEE